MSSTLTQRVSRPLLLHIEIFLQKVDDAVIITSEQPEQAPSRHLPPAAPPPPDEVPEEQHEAAVDDTVVQVLGRTVELQQGVDLEELFLLNRNGW